MIFKEFGDLAIGRLARIRKRWCNIRW